jgi:hypothetical protein
MVENEPLTADDLMELGFGTNVSDQCTVCTWTNSK